MPSSRANSATAPIKKWLTIVGIGEDGADGLSPAQQEAIRAAAHVFGGKRHLALAQSLIAGKAHSWPIPFDPAMGAVLALKGQRVCVLASGDPLCHGVGATLARHVAADDMTILPAPSAFSLAAARLGWALPETATLSLHGKPIALIRPHLQPGRHLIVLTSDEKAPAAIAAYLAREGFGASRVHLLEAIGGPQENITRHMVRDFSASDINPLNVLAIEVAADGPATRVIPCVPGLPDDWFDHDGQLTKRDFRAIALAALAPCAGDLLWDIGLGAGSIAIEWLLAAPSMRAIGIENRADRAARAKANADALGVPHLTIIEGDAPAVLSGLEAPDAIFIGGGGSDDGVMDTAIEALKSGGRLVCHAVTLETEQVLIDCHKRYGGELIRLQLARAEAVGTMTGWRPAMPVTHWRWVKR